MNLLIDVGNSRMKWGEMRNGVLGGFNSCPSRESNGLPEYFCAIEKPKAIYVASVAGKEATKNLVEQITSLWGVVPQQLGTQQFCCGVTNGYREPSQMGIDRWAAMIAAGSHYAGPLCVVDCGSAMTVDVLDSVGNHLGGLITPGLHMQQRQLLDGTAGINFREGERENEPWGRNTTSCVQLGVVETMAGLVERSAKRLSRQLAGEVRVVMTGGDAEAIKAHLAMDVMLEEHLVLEGMALIVDALED